MEGVQITANPYSAVLSIGVSIQVGQRSITTENFI
jgi:hypothetical protein